MTLSEDERATLELKRAQLGLRSLADVVRHWIRLGEDNPHSSQWSEREQAAIKARGPAPPLAINRIAPAAGVQVGPAVSAPGSRLKKR